MTALVERWEAPPPPKQMARFSILGRWISIVARAEGNLNGPSVGSDALAVAVALTEVIGPNWDRWVQLPATKVAHRLKCDEADVMAGLAKLEELAVLSVRRTCRAGTPMEKPSVMIAVPSKA